MSRPLRLIALSTALVLGATMAPVAASAAPSSAGDRPTATSKVAGADSRVAPPAVEGYAAPERFASSPQSLAPVRVFTRIDPAARGAQRIDTRAVSKKWPVRKRTGQATYHPVTPSGDLSQNFIRATITQDRLYSALYVDVALRAAPSPATDSRLRVGMGVVKSSSTGPVCTPTAGSTAPDAHTYGTTGAYQGAHIRYAERLGGMKNGTFNCAFAIMISPDLSTTYDAVTAGPLAEKRQQPGLGFRIPGKRLKRYGFTKIPVKIVNTRYTVATAYKVRLRIKTRGVAVRYRPRVGTIKPGGVKKGAIYIKDTRRGTGFVTLIVRSKDYRKKVTLKVREVRR